MTRPQANGLDALGPDTHLLGDRYRLLEVLGQGGMAVVWRAEDGLLGRRVAVKILRDQYAQDPEFLARFRSEARAAAALNDPGLVGVYDVGEDAGRHYLVMELVPGEDLKEVIRREAPLPADRVVTYATDLARAVAQAHRLGLVHRDIKPQNILISAEGRLKVADFGISRAIAEAGLTEPGIVLGTVHYLSPEQAAGRPATPASDVYALGVVIYEMLTGRLPFTADSNVGVAMKVLQDEAPPLASLAPLTPGNLISLVERAMARAPEDRYPDAGAMAEALQVLAAGGSGETLRHAALPPSPTPLPLDRAKGGGLSPALGPLLDRTGLLLGLVALMALLGLIPLWRGLMDRLSAPDPAGGSGQQDSSGLAPVAASAGDPSAESPTAPAGAPLEQVAVPAVEGLPEAEARARLEAMGLAHSSEFQTNPDIAKDHVIQQVPPAAEIVDRGAVVKLIISGSKLIQVPELAGTESSVAQQLSALGFIPRPRYEWRGASATEGQVLSIEQASLRLPAGGVVDVVVDGGPFLQLSLDFADNLFLSGVLIDRASFPAGATVSLSPRWEASRAVAGDYALRAELWGPGGAVVSREVAEPLAADGRPSSVWSAGERIAGQPVSLQLPPDLEGGSYDIWLDVFPSGSPDAPILIRQNAGPSLVQGSRARVMSIQVAGAPGGAATAPGGTPGGSATP